MCMPEGAVVWPDSLVDEMMVDLKACFPEAYASLTPEQWWLTRSKWINLAQRYDSSKRIQFVSEEAHAATPQ